MDRKIEREMKKAFFAFFLFLILLQPDISLSGGVNGLKIVCNNWPDTSTLKDFGESSINIYQAKSNEEKAIAIWRSIQHLTAATDVVPKEPALGIQYVL